MPPKRIMIVEDDAAHAEAIRRILEDLWLGVDIRIATSLHGYRECLKDSPPDIALIDLNLPDGRAMEVLSIPPEDNPFPILIMTSFGNEKVAVKALKSGALDYIVKSQESFHALPHTIERALREWELLQYRKRTEQDLRESEEKYRRLFENELTAICIFDLETLRFIDVNDAYVKLYGYSRQEILGGLTIHDITVEHEASDEATQRATADGTVFIPLRYHRRKDGTVFPVEIVGGPYSFKGRRVMFAMFRDITERKRAEHALRESESKYRQLFEVESDALFLIDVDTFNILDVNSSAEELYGYSRDEFLTMRSLDVSAQPEETTLATKKEMDHVAIRWHRKKDGAVFPVEITGSFFNMGGRRAHIAAIRDITVRMQVEQALKESEERWQFALEGSGDGVWDYNMQTKEVFYSRKSKEMLGYDEREIGNTPDEWDRRLHPDDRDQVHLAMNAYLGGRTPHYQSEHRLRCKDGEYRWILARGKIVQWTEDARPLRVIGTHTDIHERRKAEEERLQLEQRLQQAQKAESLGRMAGAIAHSFNNVLSAVIGNLELVLDDVCRGSELRKCLDEAMKASNRAAEISRFMLIYLGQTTGRAKPVDPEDAIKEALSLLGPALGGNVRLKTDISSPGPIMEADEAHLIQILTSVLSNAVEAIGESQGEITLDMKVVPGASVESGELFPPGWEAKAEEYVCISIADTGCGIVPQNLEKIFDPFYSTKFAGRGLGLAVVSGLLRTMEGAISAESQPGRGSVFKVFFPVVQECGVRR